VQGKPSGLRAKPMIDRPVQMRAKEHDVFVPILQHSPHL
jgi:hypothetical protein